MSNGIKNRQNEENSLLMLAAQRQIYNEVKRVEYIVIWLSVIMPFLCACIQIFLKDNKTLNMIAYIFPIVSLIISVIFGKYVEKKKELAAFIQQKFDVYVYQMPWNIRIFGQDKNVNSIIAEKSRKHFKKRGLKENLKNWYSPNVDAFPLEKGILECQKENFSWDVGLRKRYKISCILIIVIMLMVILGIGVVQDERISILVLRIFFIFPLCNWLSGIIKNLNTDIDRLEKLNEELSVPESKNMEKLQDIQKEIFAHRKTCDLIPDFYYRLFKDNDEDKAKRTVDIEVENYGKDM